MKKIIAIICLLVLCACSSRFATDGEHQYLKSKNGKNLVVPAPLTTSNTNYFYNLPKASKNAEVSIAPPLVDSEKQIT